MKKYLAECLGTFVLVFFACGTAAALGCNGAEVNAAYFLTALSFGLVIGLTLVLVHILQRLWDDC